MPQMSPLLWLTLYFFFLFFIIYCNKYFTYTPTMTTQSSVQYKTQQMNWKW
uniref:ATP synthase complex subunit 8 n=1 Tax=Squilla mantis TaxID=280675 RepID=Q6DVK3_SQUMA|nr:ATP synthase F0 subunit 8 [Squilla mantis]AAT69296.1 ATP synthase F0 subunit 8 [Squilla mantis]